MRFGILGPLEVRNDAGAPVAVGGPKPRALLTRLLLEAGQVVALERLGGESVNALQAQVSRLRRALPGGPVEFTGGGYRIAVDPQDVDVHRFERLARDGRQLLAAGDFRTAAGVLREALDLWRGPALADLPDAATQVVRLEEARLAAAGDLVEAELALPEGTPVGPLRRLVAEHPLRERPRGQLMRALHAAGRTAEALAEFDEARRLLAAELSADPSAELSAVHLAILRAEPPHRPQGTPPAPLTRLVGREDELERLAGLRDARLVTLVGPGGAGKTRLAVEAAGRDGREVSFADLSRVEDGALVPHAVAGALGLREGGLAPAAGAADPVRALAGRAALLVLDNCEQALDGVAGLVRALLGQCPGLAVLATSREPLGLTGEVLVPVGPLAPEPAARLFAERAAAVRAGFALDAGSAAAVASVCALLDGPRPAGRGGVRRGVLGRPASLGNPGGPYSGRAWVFSSARPTAARATAWLTAPATSNHSLPTIRPMMCSGVQAPNARATQPATARLRNSATASSTVPTMLPRTKSRNIHSADGSD
ncbi:BTAD domain-containing putative transcriptional regulator [Dactylosporangium sp. NPDC051484]|uniref:AfsR/SARP family transcriptional regulator n=1 Tax=Dactylosporangium sp. NPDC051484 TaxID=3154942 RepID=UPI00344B9484